MLGTGIGSEIRQPLGYAIVGGLFISQLLTLFTTPVVYIYMNRLSGWMERRPRRNGAEAVVPAA
jgi:Cu/Ag efflux pump CusA